MNPLADVWFGAKVESHEIARRRGLLQVYQSRAAVGDELKDPEGYWTPIYLDPLAFGIDVPMQQERRLAAPASWQDLLRPELKDQIRMPPAQSKTRQLIVATLVFLLGEERASEYLRRLDQNIGSAGWMSGIGFAHVTQAELSFPLMSYQTCWTAGRWLDYRVSQRGRRIRHWRDFYTQARGAWRRQEGWWTGCVGSRDKTLSLSAAAPLLPVAAATNPTNALERPPWPVLIPPALLAMPEVGQRVLTERWLREVEYDNEYKTKNIPPA